jgi:CheY-like chemotaxis protein
MHRLPLAYTHMAIVLFVDDEPIVRRAVKLYLEQSGHVAHTAATLAEAQAVALAHPLDGIFLDIWLAAGESGFELVDWINEHLPDLAPRVVFVTGHANPQAGAARLRRSIDRPLLAKPFEMRALDIHIAEWARPKKAKWDRDRDVDGEGKGERE